MHLVGNLHGLKLKQFDDVLSFVCVCIYFLFVILDQFLVYVVMQFQMKRLLRAANELRRWSWMRRMWQLEWSGYTMFEGTVLVFMWRDWGNSQKPDSGKLVRWLTFDPGTSSIWVLLLG
jgi:hypothetical protein